MFVCACVRADPRARPQVDGINTPATIVLSCVLLAVALLVLPTVLLPRVKAATDDDEDDAELADRPTVPEAVLPLVWAAALALLNAWSGALVNVLQCFSLLKRLQFERAPAPTLSQPLLVNPDEEGAR